MSGGRPWRPIAAFRYASVSPSSFRFELPCIHGSLVPEICLSKPPVFQVLRHRLPSRMCVKIVPSLSVNVAKTGFFGHTTIYSA